MRRIVICDSGLGGLDVAGRGCCSSSPGSGCEVIYFNACPASGRGYNNLPSLAAQQEVFRQALEGMLQFQPEKIVLACNTLSAIWESLRQIYTPPVPVLGIIDVAVAGMVKYLQEDLSRELWICGTKITIESRIYYNRLLAAGIKAERLHELSCPGLASLIESGPVSAPVQAAIAGYADEARRQLGTEPGPEKYGVALCCTHFGYSKELWRREFTRAMGTPPDVLNPNEWFVGLDKISRISYYARIPFKNNAVDCMTAFFRERSALVVRALQEANIDENLFNPHLEKWL